MEMTKRERRAARAFDYSRPAMKHDVRFLSFLGRGWCVGCCCELLLVWGGVKNEGDGGWAHTAHHRTTQGLRRQN